MDEFDGYVRADGSVGTRNLILVVSLIDLANDVAARTADLLPGAVALLTPGGGLSFGAEAALIGQLRRRTALNPNVGAVLVVGSAGEELQRWPGEIAATGRPSEAICLSDQRDSVAAVTAGVELGQRFAAALLDKAAGGCHCLHFGSAYGRAAAAWSLPGWSTRPSAPWSMPSWRMAGPSHSARPRTWPVSRRLWPSVGPIRR